MTMHTLLAWRSFRRLVQIVGVLGVAACGGGGGGGGEPPPGRFSVSTHSLSFSAASPRAAIPPSQTIVATVGGNLSGTLYILISSVGPAVGSIGSVVITSSTTGQATVFPVSPASLGIGTFASTITVRACLNDQTCATGQLSGSPQTITVSYTVSGLSASSSTVNLSALETLGSAAAPIDLSNAAGSASWTSSIAYTGVGPSGWLTLTPPSAPSLPATINFSGGPLAPGTYTATATLSAGTDSLPVGVTYIVIKALTPAPASLSYTIGDAPVPGDLTRDVTFAATTPAVNWSAAANVP